MSELFSCIIFNNGHDGPSRAHVHGIYSQSSEPFKFIRNNIIFNSFSYNFHAYGESETAKMNGYVLDGNIVFNAGAASKNYGTTTNVLIGMQEKFRLKLFLSEFLC
jgi:hypothetical protein